MPNRVRHFKVHYVQNFYKIGQKKFESMEALLEHYTRSPIYTSEEQGKAFLTNPLPRWFNSQDYSSPNL